MSIKSPTRLEQFHAFVAERIHRGDASEISPEDALILWREKEETLAAIREGLADLEAGRTWPAEDVLRELRQEKTPRDSDPWASAIRDFRHSPTQ